MRRPNANLGNLGSGGLLSKPRPLKRVEMPRTFNRVCQSLVASKDLTIRVDREGCSYRPGD
jgi:hypothetical protein